MNKNKYFLFLSVILALVAAKWLFSDPSTTGPRAEIEADKAQLAQPVPEGSIPERSSQPRSVAAADSARPNAVEIKAVAPSNLGAGTKFDVQLKQTLAELPTKAQIAQLSAEEVHQTPRPILQAAMKMGEIEEVMEANGSLQRQGINFYRDCATKADVALTLRASCYSFWLKWQGKLHLSDQSPAVSQDVIELARKSAISSEG